MSRVKYLVVIFKWPYESLKKSISKQKRHLKQYLYNLTFVFLFCFFNCVLFCYRIVFIHSIQVRKASKLRGYKNTETWASSSPLIPTYNQGISLADFTLGCMPVLYILSIWTAATLAGTTIAPSCHLTYVLSTYESQNDLNMQIRSP